MKRAGRRDRREPGGRRPRRSGGGFTLVEALFASAVLALVVAAMSQAVVSGQAVTAQAMFEARALSLAEALMEEVLALPYTDPGGDTAAGPDAGETGRADFDGMDDYDGYAEAAGALVDPAGVLYPERHQVFSRAVAASYATEDLAVLGGARDGLRVTVTVADAGGRAWTITRFVPEPAL